MAKTFRLLCALLLSGSTYLHAQVPSPPTDMTLDAAARAEVIDGALKTSNEGYVFPEVATQMEEAIRARQQRKEYDAIVSARALASALTDHLRAVGKDGHLAVNYTAQVLPPQPPPGAAPPADPQAIERQRVGGRATELWVREARATRGATSGTSISARSCRHRLRATPRRPP